MSDLFIRFRWVILTILVFVFVTLFTAEFQQAQTTAVLASALRQSTPLVFGALCGVMCERSGVVNIGIEGQMLLSAFVGFMVASATGSLIAGILAGMATGALMGAGLAGLSVTLQGDQIIAGTVLNIAAFGISSYFFQQGLTLPSGKTPQVSLGPLADLPVIGRVFFINRPLTYLSLILIWVVWFVLFRTRWGLWTRSVGEVPSAAETVGISVARVRYTNLIAGGCLAGLGGAYLSLEAVGSFERMMTNGRGFVALAVMIFGRWNPIGIWGAALLFGYASAVQTQLQFRGWLADDPQFIGMIPYVVCIVVLAGFVGRARPPAAIGQPYSREYPVGVAAPPALEVRGVTKRFGDVLANEDVDFRIERGRVHALLGENGAGKSTLVNIIFGLYQADTGEVRRNGEVMNLNGPRDAIAQQIGMVHQHFQLVPVLSVAENVVLGDEPTRHGVVDLDEAAAVVRKLSERFGLDIDPESIVEDLPIGIQQRVEILRALYREVDILILDEPTAVLTPQETGHLLEVLRGLADTGVAVVFITHKLREVMAVADEITVMRRGRVVGHAVPADTDESDLASMMVGRPVELRLKRTPASPGDKMLTIVDLVVNDDRQTQALNGINLDVRAGEVVGVAGVEGNGQRELVEAVTGLRGVISGSIILDGEEIAGRSPRQISTMGVAHIPEDREKFGLIGAHTVADNMVLNRYHHRPYSRHGIRRPAAVDDEATRLVEEFDVRPPTIAAMVATLSGGNKQKVVAAREFSHGSKVMVAAQPTRGIDIGNIEFIHRRLIEYRDAGMAILLVSAELDEVLGVSDRVAVIYGGRIVSCEPAEGIDRDRVGRLMLSGADG